MIIDITMIIDIIMIINIKKNNEKYNKFEILFYIYFK